MKARPISLGGGMLQTEDLLKATGPIFDVFSYHLYAAASKRCASLRSGLADNRGRCALGRVALTRGCYSADRFEPGKPLWVTETADAACGGNPWASTFLDTFRYLDQHGRLAQRGVQVVAHNTLASSDYGLLNEKRVRAAPQLLGSVAVAKTHGHNRAEIPALHPGRTCMCTRTACAAADQRASRDLEIRNGAERFTAGSNGALPPLTGTPIRPGQVSLAPASITFLAIPDANNSSCQ